MTASEIADFVYCPEACRLRQVGTPSVNRAEQDAGTQHHVGKAIAEQVAGGSITVGRVLSGLAMLSLAIWWLFR